MNAGTRLALFAAALVAVFFIAFFAAQFITSNIDGWQPVVINTPHDHN